MKRLLITAAFALLATTAHAGSNTCAGPRKSAPNGQ